MNIDITAVKSKAAFKQNYQMTPLILSSHIFPFQNKLGFRWIQRMKAMQQA